MTYEEWREAVPQHIIDDLVRYHNIDVEQVLKQMYEDNHETTKD